MSDYVFVYVTVPTATEAETIAEVAVSERLAACANILPGMRSVYRWQGAVEKAEETVLILKTRAVLFDQLAVRVRALHSAACPCIVALPLEAGAPDFLAWLARETT